MARGVKVQKGPGFCSRGCPRPALPNRKMCERCTATQRGRNQLEGNRLAARKYRLAQYGLTLDTYAQLVDRQGGVCAICGAAPSAPYVHLQVDHCHETGRVRGLLCHRCNKAIGLLGDGPDLLRAALNYFNG